MTYVILLIAFAGWVLALARVTRLMTADEITDFIREAVFSRWGEDSKQGYFATCPWCQSFWYGFASAWIVILASGVSWWWYPIIALAGSELVGLIASNLEPDDDFELEIKNA